MAKNALAEQAEALADSTDWQSTAAAFPRPQGDSGRRPVSRAKRDDEALWQRFRGAQEKFFSARKQTFNARDNEQKQNLTAKKALVVKAEALLPIKDAKSARKALRDIRASSLGSATFRVRTSPNWTPSSSRR